MWSTEPSGEMEVSPLGRGWPSFSQVIVGWELPVQGGKQVLAFMQSSSMHAHSLTGVTKLELFWEAGTSAQIQNYYNLDQVFRGCWMSQQEEGKLS